MFRVPVARKNIKFDLLEAAGGLDAVKQVLRERAEQLAGEHKAVSVELFFSFPIVPGLLVSLTPRNINWFELHISLLDHHSCSLRCFVIVLYHY